MGRGQGRAGGPELLWVPGCCTPPCSFVHHGASIPVAAEPLAPYAWQLCLQPEDTTVFFSRQGEQQEQQKQQLHAKGQATGPREPTTGLIQQQHFPLSTLAAFIPIITTTTSLPLLLSTAWGGYTQPPFLQTPWDHFLKAALYHHRYSQPLPSWINVTVANFSNLCIF